MQLFASPDFWASWVRIVLIDLRLAGDHALVRALADRLGAVAAFMNEVAPCALPGVITFLGWWFARGTERATELGNSPT